MHDARTLPVLVPAPAGQAGPLIAGLRARGLTVDHAPFLELRDQRDADTRQALAVLAAGDVRHLVLTSPRSVEVLLQVDAAAAGPGLALPAELEVTTVGEETAQALEALGLTPARAVTATELIGAPPTPSRAGETLLLAGPATLDPSLARALSAVGHVVTTVSTHRVRSVSLEPQIVRDLRLHGYGALVLTSPMLADLAGHLGIHRDIRVVTCDGETSARARARRLVVHGEAAAPTAEALVEAVDQALRTEIVHG